MSQIYFHVLIFILCHKTGNFLFISLIIFSIFKRKQTKTYIKNLRHSSLDSNVFNMYIKFQVCNLHNKRDIHVQKIKV